MGRLELLQLGLRRTERPTIVAVEIDQRSFRHNVQFANIPVLDDLGVVVFSYPT
jgi:hypothetical protein